MSNSFIGEVRAFPYNFAPDGWLDCMGQTVSINQYQALFGVIGFIYGGDQQSTFGLPDLRGRAVTGLGQGTGLSNSTIGQLQGADSVALVSQAQLPPHTHTITTKFMPPGTAPGASGSTPGPNAYLSRLLNPTTSPPVSHLAYAPAATTTPIVPLSPSALVAFPPSVQAAQAHENRQPFTTLRYCICATDGIYPPRP
ncbi:phage tail protein [Xanthomonas floridensis]|uniref:Phage tail protein n=1 Tax=Xanthomonas floridensis TaxID=1843580 RepID=A0A1A9M839_9XANT|nr:tail fiber protein [Xanthomonas floridensis]MEA5125689.1 tail fiber protein [Xanthomonas floridensis]MEA5133564.1 tail fiber protein [Xanthomonas floridensis]OAG66693.1 phage tail protein [Xanthomonas floridensis]